jgi:guanylate kinase
MTEASSLSSDDEKRDSPHSPKGRLFIVSAPSGAGKTTLCTMVRQAIPDLLYSISYTTRSPRPGEINGKDYNFIANKEFEEGIARRDWAEWAQVHGHYYGTSARIIEQTLAAGQSLLLDIDVQGMRQLVSRFPEAITIFIMPPSMQELDRRLRHRGTDSEETIALRLANSRREIDESRLYQHILINDDLTQAKEQLIGIFNRYRVKAP